MGERRAMGARRSVHISACGVGVRYQIEEAVFVQAQNVTATDTET